MILNHMITLAWLQLVKEMIIQLDVYEIITISRNFTWNIEKDTSIFFITEEAKERVLDFSKGTVKVLWFYFVLIKY